MLVIAQPTVIAYEVVLILELKGLLLHRNYFRLCGRVLFYAFKGLPTTRTCS